MNNLSAPYSDHEKELVGDEIARLFALQGLPLPVKTQAYFVDEISMRAYPPLYVVKALRKMARSPMEKIKLGYVLEAIRYESPSRP